MVVNQTFDPGAVLRNNFAGWVGLRYSTTYYFAAYADLSYVPVNLKYAGSGTATYSWVPTSETRYLYDGMLVIQERDTNNIPTVSYTRGVDLSGSRQGAGGIGGLLARSEHATYSPYNLTRHDSYHADGNGNITAMVYGGSELSASYQYDPYGRMMATGGTRPTVNLYRSSSKMVLTNSGLYYYGYRFYDPNLQRWPNIDPIGEAGGVNLYTFVGNAPVAYHDSFGLMWAPSKVPPTGPRNSVVCRGGKPVPNVIWRLPSWVQPTLSENGRKAYLCRQRCKYKHEDSHVQDIVAQNPTICKGVPDETYIANSDPRELKHSEVDAWLDEYHCLENCKKQCPSQGFDRDLQEAYDKILEYSL